MPARGPKDASPRGPRLRPAYPAALSLKRVLRSLGLVVGLALAACTSVGGASATDHGALRVTLVEDYFWPGAGPADIDVFPLVTALVVQRRDGRPLGPGDEGVSRDAARAYCAERSLPFPAGSTSRLNDGAWAFPPCVGL